MQTQPKKLRFGPNTSGILTFHGLPRSSWTRFSARKCSLLASTMPTLSHPWSRWLIAKQLTLLEDIASCDVHCLTCALPACLARDLLPSIRSKVRCFMHIRCSCKWLAWRSSLFLPPKLRTRSITVVISLYVHNFQISSILADVMAFPGLLVSP